jgi:acyl-[acyl-carrier-protein]-phospholipid O-acyltransferase/long-chain-fatty-acid--[acyl-carrier-protein] ligase
MVPLGAVEEFVASVWPSSMHAVVAVPDAKRGEQLVLVTSHKEAQRSVLATAARAAGLPELFVPRTIASVEVVPVLGSGKIDYVNAGQLALDRATAS